MERREDKILQYLLNCHENRALAHGHMLIGPDNRLKMKQLLRFAKEINVNQANIKLIGPENNLISIETIRELRTWLGLSSLGQGDKIAIIEKGENMKPEAQNAFLKSLEEPAEKTYIFILAGHRNQLLQTVQSRTVPIYFSNPDTQFQPEDELLSKLESASNLDDRMRIWLAANLEKESINKWLANCVPQIAKILIKSNNQIKLAGAVRQTLPALASPRGQNWQLIAENLILAL